MNRLILLSTAFFITLAGCTQPPPAPQTIPDYAPPGSLAVEPAFKDIAKNTPQIANLVGDQHPLFMEAPTLEPEIVEPETVEDLIITAQPDPEPEPTTAAHATPTKDLWDRVRDGFDLSWTNRRRIRQHARWFSRNQDYLDRVTQRATPYLHFIVEAAEERDLPLELALLPIVESAFQPFAHSRDRAMGIWQFLPATGRQYGLAQNWWYDGRRDLVPSTHAAFKYLRRLHRMFNRDWLLAIAAYNYGEGNLRRALKRNRKAGKPLDLWSLRLPKETVDYVSSLLAVATIVAQPAKYNLQLTPIPDQPYFQQIEVSGQIDLAAAAELANLSQEEFYHLNAAHKRRGTAAQRRRTFLVPVERAAEFSRGLATLAPQQPLAEPKTLAHRIQRGETLGAIARRYGTSVGALMQINNLGSTRIRAGKHLAIPATDHETTTHVAARGAAIATAERRMYVIKRGDSLWKIARRHGTTSRQLASLNGIRDSAILQPGQKIALRQRPATRSLETVRAASFATRGATKHVRYTIRRGDSLWAIARRFNVSVKALRTWNDIGAGRYIKPGQELDVFVEHEDGTERA